FFSSRRRHTRSKRDWSSDVCSSDLSLRGRFAGHSRAGTETPRKDAQVFDRREACSSKARPLAGEVHSPSGKATGQILREIPHIGRPTALQERSGKKKSACIVRNDA